MDALARDIRHAARVLARHRTFTLTALAILAVGIGANTAMFSVVYGLLLRPLPYPDADAIVRVGYGRSAQPESIGWLTNRNLPRLQEEAESLEQVAGYAPRALGWRDPEGPISLRGAMVSPSLFPLLRATPRLGRLFTDDDARQGAHRVVLLSFRTWNTRFAADPDIAGAPIELDGEPYTVVGVLADGFAFPGPEDELWTPMVMQPSAPSRMPGAARSRSRSPSRPSDASGRACHRHRPRPRSMRSSGSRTSAARRRTPEGRRAGPPPSSGASSRCRRRWSASTGRRCWF